MKKSEYAQTNSFTEQQREMIEFLEQGLTWQEMEIKSNNKEVTLRQRRLAVEKKIELIQRDVRWLRDIGLINFDNDDIQILYKKLKANEKWD